MSSRSGRTEWKYIFVLFECEEFSGSFRSLSQNWRQNAFVYGKKPTRIGNKKHILNLVYIWSLSYPSWWIVLRKQSAIVLYSEFPFWNWKRVLTTSRGCMKQTSKKPAVPPAAICIQQSFQNGMTFFWCWLILDSKS